jgi:hypothetical protein
MEARRKIVHDSGANGIVDEWPNIGGRMTREGHVRFWERVGDPRATRQVVLKIAGLKLGCGEPRTTPGSCSLFWSNADANWRSNIINSGIAAGTILFPVRELIATFEDKVLCPIIDLCAEHRLFLDDLGLL